jgi:hypothetical protein
LAAVLAALLTAVLRLADRLAVLVVAAAAVLPHLVALELPAKVTLVAQAQELVTLGTERVAAVAVLGRLVGSRTVVTAHLLIAPCLQLLAQVKTLAELDTLLAVVAAQKAAVPVDMAVVVQAVLATARIQLLAPLTQAVAAAVCGTSLLVVLAVREWFLLKHQEPQPLQQALHL